MFPYALLLKYGSKITRQLNFAHINTQLQWQIVGELYNFTEVELKKYILLSTCCDGEYACHI